MPSDLEASGLHRHTHTDIDRHRQRHTDRHRQTGTERQWDPIRGTIRP